MDRSAVLVEGESDKAALEAVARLHRLDLSTVAVLVMGGATNIGRFVAEAVSKDLSVAGLYDAGEKTYVVRALEGAGLIEDGSFDLEGLGFFECAPDLEAELIAAVGTRRVIEVVEQQGEDLRRLRSMQQMPEWRGRPVEDQLRRWLGSGGGRKVRYASLLVKAMAPGEVPPPLVRVLEYAVAAAS